MEGHINTLLIKFDNEIAFDEIPLLRGAILDKLGENASILFHNHINNESFRYSYPLIQYKRVQKKAAMLCIGKGVEDIGQIFGHQNMQITLGKRDVCLKIDKVIPQRILVQVWDSEFKYHLRNWLALNSENYTKYKEIDDLSSRITFLENILKGNILSFAKGLNINIAKEITCKLQSLDEPRLVMVKNVKMMAFDVEFKSNITIPNYIGIGKHASFGYGTVVKNNE